MITKEQEEDFKRRRANSIVSDSEHDEFNKTSVKFTEEQYLEFLKATDEKCK